MSDKIALLPGAVLERRGEPNPELVAIMSDLLEAAKSGHLQNFIGVGFTTDNLRVECWGHFNVLPDLMLGGLTRIQHNYFDKVDLHEIWIEGDEPQR